MSDCGGTRGGTGFTCFPVQTEVYTQLMHSHGYKDVRGRRLHTVDTNTEISCLHLYKGKDLTHYTHRHSTHEDQGGLQTQIQKLSRVAGF